jgi:protein-disulfide isomerase
MVKPQRRSPDRSKFYITLGGAAILGAAVLGYAATQGGGASAITLDPTVTASGTVEGYVLGNPTAPVEIVEYGDFECGACAQFAILTEPQVRERLVQTGVARFRFLDFPLSMHPNSVPAHLAAACAADQGKFWEMHDRLFNGQHEWNGQVTRNPKGIFEGYVQALGIDENAWDECYEARRHIPRISASVAQGQRLRVRSTPTFIIGDQLLPGALAWDQLKAYVDSAAAKARSDSTVRRIPGQ